MYVELTMVLFISLFKLWYFSIVVKNSSIVVEGIVLIDTNCVTLPSDEYVEAINFESVFMKKASAARLLDWMLMK